MRVDSTKSCRSCGSTELIQFLSLGTTPLANALLTAAQLDLPEARFPLELAFCRDCSLVQLLTTIAPDRLFRHYLYFTSFADTAVASARAIADRMIDVRGLTGSSLVLELASNDGYLLQHYKNRNIPILGIEPAENIAKVAVARGIPTMSEFFDRNLAVRLKTAGMRADVLHANNVLAHVPDLNGFVAGIATVLKNRGIAVIEVPYLRNLISNIEFDTIYHEHLCYFSLMALDRLFSRHHLRIVDVEHLSIHGGSLRLLIVPESRNTSCKPSVNEMLRTERAEGLDRAEYYSAFASRISALKEILTDLLRSLKSEGMSIAAYGASAKGSTLLNYLGLGEETIDFVVDRSTAKQGYYTPGTHLKILPPVELLTKLPDYVLLLSWNFADEILTQQREYLQRGGRFIVPLPELRIV